MDTNYTHLTVLLDRSGSMSAIKESMESGFDEFVNKQKAVSGRCTVSLYQFDTEYERVYNMVEISKVPNLNLVPRGMTALIDAMGRTINDLGDQLSRMNESERPGKVILVIITDGLENASKEFVREKVREMIRHQEEKYSWEVVFIGANMDDVFGEAGSFGVAIWKTFEWDQSPIGTSVMYNALNKATTEYRTGITKGMSMS